MSYTRTSRYRAMLGLGATRERRSDIGGGRRRFDTTAYPKSVAAFLAKPNKATHQAMVKAYDADLADWNGAKAALDAMNRGLANSYDQAMKEYQTKLDAYYKAQEAIEARNREIAEATALQRQYQQAIARRNEAIRVYETQIIPAYQAALANYNSVLVPQWQRYVGQAAGFASTLASRRAALMAQSRAVAAQEGFTLPTGYPGCISVPHQQRRAAQCTEHEAQFVRGLGSALGATESDATGAWAGIPHCSLAKLPTCPAGSEPPEPPFAGPPVEPQLPASDDYIPALPAEPGPIPTRMVGPSKPTSPKRPAGLSNLRDKPEPPPPLPALPDPIQLRLPPAPDQESLRCRPDVAITDAERAILDKISGLYNTMMARVQQCQTSYMPTINRLRQEVGPVADLEAARQQLVACVAGHVEQYNQAVLEQHQLLSELCAQLNAPPPPEPETSPLEVTQRAQAGFGASGLLMVLALAGGGYAAWKLLSRKKKG